MDFQCQSFTHLPEMPSAIAFQRGLDPDAARLPAVRRQAACFTLKMRELALSINKRDLT